MSNAEPAPSRSAEQPVRIGARTSPLARVQAELVARLLADRGVPSVFVGVTTKGDVDPRDLTVIGGTGVFTGAVRDALRAGEIDVAVHSLKDLPTAPEPDLELAAVPAREDTRDVLVGLTVADLAAAGGVVRIGTGAPRRALQLYDLAARLGVRIEVQPVRGNVDTRLRHVREGRLDAVVLAAAGLIRLGHLATAEVDGDEVDVAGLRAQILSLADMLPAPGQGALALEIFRTLRMAAATPLRALDDRRARAESQAERGFLASLEAGCTAPVGARATLHGSVGDQLDLTLDAVIGRTLLSNLSEPATAGTPLRRTLSGRVVDPREFGVSAGAQVLSELSYN